MQMLADQKQELVDNHRAVQNKKRAEEGLPPLEEETEEEKAQKVKEAEEEFARLQKEHDDRNAGYVK